MPSQNTYSLAAKVRHPPTAGIKKKSAIRTGIRSRRLAAVASSRLSSSSPPPEANRGDLRNIPCQGCALGTGLCYTTVDDDDECLACKERGDECQNLPKDAIENGKAITAATISGASHFTTGLLIKNLKRLLQSLSEEEKEGEAEGLRGDKMGKGGKRSRSSGYARWHRTWTMEGAEPFIDSEEEEVNDGEAPNQAQGNNDGEKVDEDDEDDVPLVRLRVAIEARRSRIKKLVGELVDLLVR
ncbi:hypothetical protein BR93DRAFT_966215 [Coniochaeta sp. PMI_546]|nr:hypothetical protein BR93DRAFT_966215 [Coniochaeta sp. PMI_546]